MSGKLSQEEVSATVEFCLNAFEHHAPEKQEQVLKKMETAMLASNVEAPANVSTTKTEAAVEKKAIVDPEGLSPDEMRILNTIRARQMLRREDTLSIDNFTNDPINGWVPIVERGRLGLQKAMPKSAPKGPATEQAEMSPAAVEQAEIKPVAVEQVAMSQVVVDQAAMNHVAMDQLTGPLLPAITV